MDVIELAFGIHHAGTRRNNDYIIFGIELLHIHPLAECNAQLAALSDRETMDSIVMAHHFSILILNLAGFFYGRIALFNKLSQLAFFNKAEVLAFAARNNRQAALDGIGFHFGLWHFCQWE